MSERQKERERERWRDTWREVEREKESVCGRGVSITWSYSQ